jgi:hypothetical protein
LRDLIKEISEHPDQVRQGDWNPKGGGGEDYRFYQRGSDVVVATPENEFVTILKDGTANGWFQRARSVDMGVGGDGLPEGGGE